MQCIWSKTAKSALGSILRLPHSLRARSNIFSAANARLASTLPVAAEVQLKPRYFEPNSTPLILPPSLTAPQLSRAASQAVRLSIQNGALEDAYYIVNSLRYSVLREDKAAQEKMAGLRMSLTDFETTALYMGRGVSPRSASHALLHGLVRLGLTRKASKLSEIMMASGIRLRSVTLETIISTLASAHASPRTQLPMRPFPPTQEILKLKASMVRHEGARLALQLVLLARKSRQRRTSGMFGTLLCACLINGEIIVASLIFGLIVKDYQIRKSLATCLAPVNASSDAAEPNRKMKDIQTRLDHLRTERLVPSQTSMYSIISSIDQTLSIPGEGEINKVSIHLALQALANLASLLDHRQIPFSQISPLIRSLYNCPQTEDKVWIVDCHGHPKLVQAYSYFHGVLKRLIDNLPRKTRPTFAGITQPTTFELLPSLDVPSYNALLHYVLRHRLSPSLADKILHHMMRERHPPRRPDAVTYNILIRAGTLLRMKGVAEQALQLLHRRQEVILNGLLGPLEAQHHIFDPAEEPLRSLPALPGSSGLRIDIHTITSYITHLVSTREPRAVLAFVHDILRVFTTGTSARADQTSRDSQLRLIAAEGPYIFTAVLNALDKAGEWNLAERVWRFAKRAEKASWAAPLGSGVRPWYLPEHAYTSMLKCYITEEEMIARHKPIHWRSTVMKRAQAVYDSLLQVQFVLAATPSPKPDARFFNAALRLFLQDEPRLGRTYPGASPKECRKGLHDANVEHARTGELPTGWNPMLQTIAEDMVDAGYSVPPGLRPLFVGRWPQGTWQHSDVAQPQHRPFGFPRHRKAFSSHSIPTSKNRGFPIHRRPRCHPFDEY